MNQPASLALPTPASLNNNPHYLHALTQTAARHALVCTSDVVDAAGVCVLAAGTRLTQAHLALLTQHNLAAPIDECLAVQDDPVDMPTIEAEVMMLSMTHPLGQDLARVLGGPSPLLDPLRHVQWPAAAHVKFAVLRAQNPELFEHTLLMMMMSVYLAIQAGMRDHECASVATAALWHDIGMLYLPPHWADHSHRFTPEERLGLAQHPGIACVLLRQAQVYGPDIQTAVLQHHERLDGSGYPMQLPADAIVPMGRVLLLSEVVTAFYGKYGEQAAQRLSLALRLNHMRFPAEFTKHALAMLAEGDAADAPLHTMGDVRENIAVVSRIYGHWHEALAQVPEDWARQPEAPAWEFVLEKIAATERGLIESGLHPRQSADWSRMFEEDPYGMSELVFIVREAVWQIEALIHTALRRWPQILATDASEPIFVRLAQWIRATLPLIAQARAQASA